MPFRPPARDDDGESVRRGNQWFRSIDPPVTAASMHPGFSRPAAGHCHVEREGGCACETSLPMRQRTSGRRRVGGRLSSRTVLFASGEVPRMPTRPPARDDRGESVRRGNQWFRSIDPPVTAASMHPGFSRPAAGHCHVEREGGWACETSLPMREGTSGRRRVGGRLSSRTILFASGRSLACPPALPLGTTGASRFGEGISGFAPSILPSRLPRCIPVFLDPLPAIVMSNGRAGGHVRHLCRCEKGPPGADASGDGCPAERSFSHRGVPRMPTRPPARDDRGESVRRGNQWFRSIDPPVTAASMHPGFSRPAAGHCHVEREGGWACETSLPMREGTSGRRRVGGRLSSRTVLFASGEVPRMPFRPPARDDNGESVRRGNQWFRSIDPPVTAASMHPGFSRPAAGHCHVEREGGWACETSLPMREGTSGRRRVGGRLSSRTVLFASGEVPRMPTRPPARDDSRGERCARGAVRTSDRGRAREAFPPESRNRSVIDSSGAVPLECGCNN